MKLYIDGLFYKAAGIGRYYESLLNEFALKGIEIITAVPSSYEREFMTAFKYHPNIKPLFVPYERFSLRGFIEHYFILRKIEKFVDVFFFPHVNLPYYVPKRTVITVHDLIPFTEYWESGFIKKIFFKFYLDRAIKKAKKIICISERVQEKLIIYNPSVAHKISIIYEFVNDKFTLYKNTKRLIDMPYILFVGSRKRHKNIEGLIRAFYLLKDRIHHHLVIVGRKDRELDFVDELISELKLQERVILTEKTSDEELISLYKYADIFVFPSFLEGFGLPPLEAVSLGCTVVLSDIPVLREVFDEAGVYFNPRDSKDMANKIFFLLNNPREREYILQRQKERLTFFEKNSIINEYLKVFQKVKGE